MVSATLKKFFEKKLDMAQILEYICKMNISSKLRKKVRMFNHKKRR